MRQIFYKIKKFIISNQKDILVVSVIILVAVAGFAIGRISVLSEMGQGSLVFKRAPMVPKNTASVAGAVAEIEIPTMTTGGQLLASKNGTKYYFPWCGGVSRIKEENKVWFASEEEARKAGFEPAENCTGLGE